MLNKVGFACSTSLVYYPAVFGLMLPRSGKILCALGSINYG